MEKTIINIKTDKELKREAQKTAKELGLPLSTIINAYLKELINEKRVIFSVHPQPNKKTGELLDKILKDIEAEKNLVGPFKNTEEIDKYLNS